MREAQPTVMEPTDHLPTSWAGRQPPRFWDGCLILIIEVVSVALQIWGVREINVFPRSHVAGNTPIVVYSVGFVLQLVAMSVGLGSVSRKAHLSISADEIRLGQRRISRATATVSLAIERRFGRASRRLQMSGDGQQWQLRAPGEAQLPQTQMAMSVPRGKVDAVMTALDLDEIVAVLSASSLARGVRIDLSPYRASARAIFEFMLPWFATMLILGVIGLTLGPLLAHTKVGPLIMPPLCLFGACLGIFAQFVSFYRPRRGMRAILGAQDITLVDKRTGRVVASASRAVVRAVRVHYALFGKGDRLTNPGLRLEFPDGFKIALAIPLMRRRWPEHVARSWAPHWTIDLEAVPALLAAFGQRP